MRTTNKGEGAADNGQTLNLALLGYGKMGRVIAQLAPARDFQVRLVLDVDANRDGAGITRENFEGIDVCVDFTTPEAALENIRRVAGLGGNLVVGTTGWHDKIDEVRRLVESCGVGLVYGANFSIGVQLFYRVAQLAAQVFSRFPLYEPYIVETHHQFKKDAPSGTALELRKQVTPALQGREVAVSSVRGGYFPGTHELGFDSEADTVIIRHTARSRQSFAEGALHAARWVVGKKGLFTFGETLATERKEATRA